MNEYFLELPLFWQVFISVFALFFSLLLLVKLFRVFIFCFGKLRINSKLRLSILLAIAFLLATFVVYLLNERLSFMPLAFGYVLSLDFLLIGNVILGLASALFIICFFVNFMNFRTRVLLLCLSNQRSSALIFKDSGVYRELIEQHQKELQNLRDEYEERLNALSGGKTLASEGSQGYLAELELFGHKMQSVLDNSELNDEIKGNMIENMQSTLESISSSFEMSLSKQAQDNLLEN